MATDTEIVEKIKLVRMALREQYEKDDNTAINKNPCSNPTKSDKQHISFQKLETNKHLTLFHYLNISSAHMRNILHKIYVKQRQIPTMADIIKVAKDNNFYKLTNTNPKGFIVLPIISPDKGIIIEDQERVAKRTAYIMKMDNFRKNGQHFIYIGELHKQSMFMKFQAPRLLIAVSSKTGFLSFSDVIQCVDDEIKFLTDVLSSINGQCVLVLEEEEEEEKLLPTAGSPKSTMITWLEQNNIPHPPKLHRSELYSLINKMKNAVSYTSKVDTIILALGHHVVKRPSDMEELNFFGTCSNVTYNYVKNMPLEKWFEIEDKLTATEKTMYINDLMMEKIIDSIMAFAKDTNDPETIQGFVDITDWKKAYNSIIIE